MLSLIPILKILRSKIFTNKKSSETPAHLIFWMMFAVFIGMIVIVLVKIGNVSVEDASTIPESLEDEIMLAGRFYNSKDCFTYVDDVDTVHVGIIDANKFTQGVLDTCFPTSNVVYAFKLSLEQPVEVGPVFTFGTMPIQTFNWDYTRFITKEIIENVVVLYNNQMEDGILRIQIKDVE